MGLTLNEVATGCVKQPESRLEHQAIIKTFAGRTAQLAAVHEYRQRRRLQEVGILAARDGAGDERDAAARALLHPGRSRPGARLDPAGPLTAVAGPQDEPQRERSKQALLAELPIRLPAITYQRRHA